MSCRGIFLRSRHGAGSKEVGGISAIVGGGTNATGGPTGKAMGVSLSNPLLPWDSADTTVKAGGTSFLGMADKDATGVARGSAGGV